MVGFRGWVWMHKWSSLISTAFLLVLCATGLPLIFHDEIDGALGHRVTVSGGAAAPLGAVERAGLTARPGWRIQFLVWEPARPGTVTLSMAPAGAASFYDNRNVVVDATTARVLPDRTEGGVMDTILTLHSQLFLGPWGPLVLGIPSILFLVALVSGVVIYAPFARRRPFAHVRTGQSRRTRWLDLHNVVGATIVAWMLVVAFTGLVNTWGSYIVRIWQVTELSGVVVPAGGANEASLERIVNAARTSVPAGDPYFVAYPGSAMSGEGFHAVYLRGRTPLTRFVFQPVLVDSRTARVLAVPRLPWYIKALALSQPLHFGNFGGLPLKIIWALLDLAAIFVLGSGAVLSLRSRADPSRREAAEADA